MGVIIWESELYGYTHDNYSVNLHYTDNDNKVSVCIDFTDSNVKYRSTKDTLQEAKEWAEEQIKEIRYNNVEIFYHEEV